MLSALDIGILPQSMDGVGILRYTTNVSECVAGQVPIVTGRLPFAYDLADQFTWRLPGHGPWDARYVSALGALMDTVDHAEADAKRRSILRHDELFSRSAQQRRVGEFIREVIADLDERPSTAAELVGAASIVERCRRPLTRSRRATVMPTRASRLRISPVLSGVWQASTA